MPFFVLQLVVTCLTQYMSQFKYCVICIWRLPIVYGAEGVWVVGQEDSVLYEHGCIAPGVAGRCCLSQGPFRGQRQAKRVHYFLGRLRANVQRSQA